MAKGDPRFHELLRRLGELHDKKQADYGSDEDPFANIRASEEWGVDGWAGALMRANDKMHRLQRYVAKGELANESAVDSMMDIAVYAMIASILYTEQSEKEKTEGTTTSTMDGAKAVVSSPTQNTCPVCKVYGDPMTSMQYHTTADYNKYHAPKGVHSESCNNFNNLKAPFGYAPCWNPSCVNYVEN